MVVLNKITNKLPCKVYAKYETFNPGNSRVGVEKNIISKNKCINFSVEKCSNHLGFSQEIQEWSKERNLVKRKREKNSNSQKDKISLASKYSRLNFFIPLEYC